MSEEDGDNLWQRVTKDIKPLRKPAAPPKPKKKTTKAQPVPDKPAERVVFAPALKPALSRSPSVPAQLDARTDTKLRRGQIRIEATLDLHGMTQPHARSALHDFLIAAQGSGKRCVLVITGKGVSRRRTDEWMDAPPGILKQKFPQWLTEPPLDRIVLKHTPAQPKHGGGGAFYVYLKRDR